LFWHKEHQLLTEQYLEWRLITEMVEGDVAESGIWNGIVLVASKHTTTGILVNEALECLESDMNDFLMDLAPETGEYRHARMLRAYGSTAGNPTGHLKSLITGNHCAFPIVAGCMVRGGAQDIYFCEFDGPAQRTWTITVVGERG